MKLTALVLFVFMSATAFAADNITYFSCDVKEDGKTVNVKFAVKDLDPEEAKGELVEYPGADENMGLILVSPEKLSKNKWSKMSNLNGQGGDLRVRANGDIFLFGDGDGYQYTDFVVWYDGEDELDYREGYVRDYGSAYAEGEETFKQFVKCTVSKKVL